MRKLLITGSSGMLGSNLVSELKDKYEIIGLYKSLSNPALKRQLKINLAEYNEVTGKVIKKIKPDFVIHCAALTDVDACENDYSFAYTTNAAATGNLITGLGSEVRFIYISTDSIFDGKKGNYKETDEPHPLNNYARSKLEGESLVERLSNNYVIIRTNIFGWNYVKGTSFAEWVYNRLTQKKPIKMFTDVVFSPITVNTLSLMVNELLQSDFVGKLHIASNNSMSKYSFGMNLAKLCNFDESLITPVGIDTFGFKAKRPKNTSLNVAKAKGILGYLPSAEEELEKFCQKKKVINEAIC